MKSRDPADLSPATASQPPTQSQTKRRGTHDQPTVLHIYRFLLGKLDAGSTVGPEVDRRNPTSLILHDCVPNVLRKFAHGLYVCLIFLISNYAGSLRNVQQFVLDSFKSPEKVSTWAPRA